MRSLMLIVTCTLAFCQGCTREVTIEKAVEPVAGSDSLLGCCLADYELTENGDTINKTYGKEKKKHGHWVTYVFVNKQEKAPVVRAKLEEGNYTVNKREGYWLEYNKDGSVRDSVEYRNDAPVIPLK